MWLQDSYRNKLSTAVFDPYFGSRFSSSLISNEDVVRGPQKGPRGGSQLRLITVDHGVQVRDSVCSLSCSKCPPWGVGNKGQQGGQEDLMRPRPEGLANFQSHCAPEPSVGFALDMSCRT